MIAFLALTKAGVTTRDAAGLTGVSRATAGRVPRRAKVSSVSDGLCTGGAWEPEVTDVTSGRKEHHR